MRIRRQARIIAIQALYELDLTDHPPEVVMRRRIEDESLAPEGVPFVYHLVNGILAHREELDNLIQPYLL